MEQNLVENPAKIDFWQDDLIGRKQEADFIKNYILSKLDLRSELEQPRSLVLNLDAPWGSGKTKFLESFEKQLKQDGYLVARVNAWIDDHSDDPLTAVISAIQDVVVSASPSERAKNNLRIIKRNVGKIAIAAARGIAQQFLRKHLGDAAHEISEIFANDPKDNSNSTEGSALRNRSWPEEWPLLKNLLTQLQSDCWSHLTKKRRHSTHFATDSRK